MSLNLRARVLRANHRDLRRSSGRKPQTLSGRPPPELPSGGAKPSPPLLPKPKPPFRRGGQGGGGSPRSHNSQPQARSRAKSSRCSPPRQWSRRLRRPGWSGVARRISLSIRRSLLADSARARSAAVNAGRPYLARSTSRRGRVSELVHLAAAAELAEVLISTCADETASESPAKGIQLRAAPMAETTGQAVEPRAEHEGPAVGINRTLGRPDEGHKPIRHPAAARGRLLSLALVEERRKQRTESQPIEARGGVGERPGHRCVERQPRPLDQPRHHAADCERRQVKLD
eukprot:scaffold8264_cov109-Isochrysis_galbana.AAC.12